MSRRGVQAGSIPAPAGYRPRPDPKAAEAAKIHEWSNEVAILIGTEESLEPTEAASAVEDSGYVRSWV